VEKLTLNVEALAVDSFPTAEPGEARGTVAAHMISNGQYTCQYLCNSRNPTCVQVC